MTATLPSKADQDVGASRLPTTTPIRVETYEARYADYGDGLITRFGAAAMLGVNLRTIDRYIKLGYLRVADQRRGKDGFARNLLLRADVDGLVEAPLSSQGSSLPR